MKCGEVERKEQRLRFLSVRGDMTTWTRPTSLAELKSLLKAQPHAQLVCGNTASGECFEFNRQ